MRKGRSSRRSRISRPLVAVSVKGESLSSDLVPASSGNVSARVVIGISPSDPPSAVDTPESWEPAEAPPPVIAEMRGGETPMPGTLVSFTKALVERVAELPPPAFEPEPEPVAEPTPVDEPVAAEAAEAEEEAEIIEEAPAPTNDLAATLFHGSVETTELETTELETTEVAPRLADPAATLVFGSLVDAIPESRPEPIQGALLPAARDRLAEIRERHEARDRLREKRSVAQAAFRAEAPSTDPDEVSVPPAGDIGVEDDEKFFSSADVSLRAGANERDGETEDDLVPEKSRRKSLPHIVQRRAKLAGYVKMAVAGAAFVCLAAAGRSALHANANAKTAAATHAEIKAPEPPVQVASPAPKAAEPAVVIPPPEPIAEPAAEAPADPPVVTGDAKEELKKSRTALEHRKIADAIEAGERSVAIDPTDGEAWLILGASYQEKGDMVNARRAYSACLKQGKTGPRSECGKMLR